MAYELLHEHVQSVTGSTLTPYIIGGVYLLLLFGPVFGLTIFRTMKRLQQYPPPIDDNSSEYLKEYVKWENEYNEYNKKFGFGWKRNIFIFVGYFLLLTALFIIAIILFVT